MISSVIDETEHCSVPSLVPFEVEGRKKKFLADLFCHAVSLDRERT